MSALRVLYSFPTRLGVPGIGMTAWHQVEGLARLGVHVTLCCGSCEKAVPGVGRVFETMKVAGLPLSYKAMGLDRAMAWHDRRVARLLRHIHNELDLVHCWPSGSLGTIDTAHEFGLPAVLERPSAHTAQAYAVTQQESERLGLRPRKGHYGSFNQKRLAREEAEFLSADYLLCPSDFAARTFIERGFAPEKIKRHQYGYDPSRFSVQTSGAARKSDTPFAMVFVGECFPLKGLHLALRAWHDCGVSARGKFYICGRFNPEYQQALGTQLNQPGVELLGFVEDVSKVMRQCDALVLPSLSEGSALVTYEARACGLVLLVSTSSGAPCEHLRDGLIHPTGDVATLASHIAMLANQPELGMRLREASLRELPELTWDRAGRRLCEVYQDALDHRN